MSKEYNAEIQARLERFLKEERLSQSMAAPILQMSTSKISQYRRSIYNGDIAEIERSLTEFFRIKDEQKENFKKAEPYKPVMSNYIPTFISESVYKLIRYCQLEKGIVVIDGDAGIGKTKAAGKFLQDNPSTTIYLKASPSTGTLRSLLKMIARTLKISDSQRTDELSQSIQEKLKQTDNILIIDEAQNLKFSTLEEITRWSDEELFTGKPGIGIVLMGNVEVYNRMLGRQEAMFSQQFSRTRLPGRFYTTDIQREDVIKLLPLLSEKGMEKEIDYMYRICRSKWALRGMVNVYNNAVNNEDISLKGLEKMANTMGIRLI